MRWRFEGNGRMTTHPECMNYWWKQNRPIEKVSKSYWKKKWHQQLYQNKRLRPYNVSPIPHKNANCNGCYVLQNKSQMQNIVHHRQTASSIVSFSLCLPASICCHYFVSSNVRPSHGYTVEYLWWLNRDWFNIVTIPLRNSIVLIRFLATDFRTSNLRLSNEDDSGSPETFCCITFFILHSIWKFSIHSSLACT